VSNVICLLFIIYSTLFRSSRAARSSNFRSIFFPLFSSLVYTRRWEKVGYARARAREREREREREGERELQCIFLRCIPPFSLRLINRLIKSDELRFKLRASRSSSEPLIFRSSVRQLSSGVAFAFAYNSSQLSRWLSCAAALIRDGIAVR